MHTLRDGELQSGGTKGKTQVQPGGPPQCGLRRVASLLALFSARHHRKVEVSWIKIASPTGFLSLQRLSFYQESDPRSTSQQTGWTSPRRPPIPLPNSSTSLCPRCFLSFS